MRLTISVRGKGLEPTTAANSLDGCSGFWRAGFAFLVPFFEAPLEIDVLLGMFLLRDECRGRPGTEAMLPRVAYPQFGCFRRALLASERRPAATTSVCRRSPAPPPRRCSSPRPRPAVRRLAPAPWAGPHGTGALAGQSSPPYPRAPSR